MVVDPLNHDHSNVLVIDWYFFVLIMEQNYSLIGCNALVTAFAASGFGIVCLNHFASNQKVIFVTDRINGCHNSFRSLVVVDEGMQSVTVTVHKITQEAFWYQIK